MIYVISPLVHMHDRRQFNLPDFFPTVWFEIVVCSFLVFPGGCLNTCFVFLYDNFIIDHNNILRSFFCAPTKLLRPSPSFFSTVLSSSGKTLRKNKPFRDEITVSTLERAIRFFSFSYVHFDTRLHTVCFDYFPKFNIPLIVVGSRTTSEYDITSV